MNYGLELICCRASRMAAQFALQKSMSLECRESQRSVRSKTMVGAGMRRMALNGIAVVTGRRMIQLRVQWRGQVIRAVKPSFRGGKQLTMSLAEAGPCRVRREPVLAI